jgi:hypothetical protein
MFQKKPMAMQQPDDEEDDETMQGGAPPQGGMMPPQGGMMPPQGAPPPRMAAPAASPQKMTPPSRMGKSMSDIFRAKKPGMKKAEPEKKMMPPKKGGFRIGGK